MSSTRQATDGAFHQSRYASSPEFHHGLAANLVAMKTSTLENESDRQLIWWLQCLSHQPGGMAAVASDLLSRRPDRIGTAAMLAIGKDLAGIYNADEVRKIRLEMPRDLRAELPLQGDMDTSIKLAYNRAQVSLEGAKRDYKEDSECVSTGRIERLQAECNQLERQLKDCIQEADRNPNTYPVPTLQQLCIKAALNEGALEKSLCQLCLDPAFRPLEFAPWYFATLVETLRDYQKQWTRENSKGVETAVVKTVDAMLDFTSEQKGLTLLTGPSNVGARFAAREWCKQNAGRARFCEVPPSNDEASFFRSIGAALGGNFTNYKNVQIRERVESVLQSGELMLVLYCAQNLWPVMNLREAFPKRLNWLIDQTEKGAAVCMIAGPQFFMQKRSCEKTGWDAPELKNKLCDAAALPESLTVEEMTAIARVVLPDATADDCELMAIGAVGSQKYLANVEAVVKRAKYLAGKAGRIELTAADVDQAVAHVNQSDTLIREALGQNEPARPGRRPKQTIQPLTASSPRPALATPQAPRNRAGQIGAPASPSQRANITEIVPG